MRFVAETPDQQQLDQGAKKQQQQQQEQQQWKLRPPFRWRSKSAQRSEGDGGDQVAAAADQNGLAARRQRSASPCSLEQNRSASKSHSYSYLRRLSEVRGEFTQALLVESALNRGRFLPPRRRHQKRAEILSNCFHFRRWTKRGRGMLFKRNRGKGTPPQGRTSDGLS